MKKIFKGINELYSLAGIAEKLGRHPKEKDLSIINKAAFVVEKGRLIWVGKQTQLPKEFARQKCQEIDLKNQNVYPGFVESHTHLLFAGSRAKEFEMRLNGASYQEIAAQGGGILSTMRSTREASATELKKTGIERVKNFIEQGVTTVEIKSGYGLSLKDEVKTLKVANEIGLIRIVPTFLGAHALPPEFKSHNEYLIYLTDKVLPEIKKKKLACRVDIFIEKGFFEFEAANRYLQAAKKLGFEITIHADQLTLSGGTDAAIELAAHSADHVIQVQEKQIQKLAKSDTVAVLLPAADMYMKCNYPPARKLIDAGVTVALATDFNPGTSPTQDVNLVGLLARLEMKMTLPEVFSAYTWGAAKALGLHKEVGSLQVGKSADFFSTKTEWSEFFYSAGSNIAKNVYSNGNLLSPNKN